MMRDFDNRFRDDLERRRRQVRLISAFVVALWCVAACAIGWGLTHPEAIGAFLGRISAGFSSATHSAEG